MREASPIVDVIGERVALRPAGSGRYVGLCPFHQEKTPSFHVDASRQSYYCFGCKAGGDVFRFLGERDGLPFRDALHLLARRAGIPIPERNPERAARWEALRKAARDALDHYQAALRADGGRRARDYLAKKRGVPREDFGEYGFGFAPAGTTLREALERKGSPRKILLETGLVREAADRPGAFFDFFRNRLIIPIFDANGQVAGFAGRSLDGSEPKYVNSPDSPIYRKKTVLYGLHRAKPAIRRERSAVLLEGYFDCVAAWRAGVPQAVAVCGTAFTPEHAQLLKTHAREVVLCFDADAGGQRAALRSLPILLRNQLRVRVASLGSGRDPDDFIREEGGEAFRRVLSEAPGFVEFLAGKNGGSDGGERAARFRETLEILACWPSPLEREAWLDQAARAAGFSAASAREEMAGILERKRAEPAPPPADRPSSDDQENPWKGFEEIPDEEEETTKAAAITPAERDLIRWGMERPREVAALLRQACAQDLLGFVASDILTVMKDAADRGAADLFGGEDADWDPTATQLLEAARTADVPLNTEQQRPEDCLRAILLAGVGRDRRDAAGADLARVQELNRRLDQLRRGEEPFSERRAGNP